MQYDVIKSKLTLHMLCQYSYLASSTYYLLSTLLVTKEWLQKTKVQSMHDWCYYITMQLRCAVAIAVVYYGLLSYRHKSL